MSDKSAGEEGHVSDRAARVRLDVRWDAATVAAATALAEGRGVRPAVVMREAVEIGLRTLVNGGERALTAGAGARVVGDLGGVTSAVVGTLPGAGSASSRAPVGADDPRPSAPTQPAVATVRLEHVVARLLANGLAAVTAGSDAALDALRQGRVAAPADVARARRRVLAGRVMVRGGVCRNPTQSVDPVDVGLA